MVGGGDYIDNISGIKPVGWHLLRKNGKCVGWRSNANKKGDFVVGFVCFYISLNIWLLFNRIGCLEVKSCFWYYIRTLMNGFIFLNFNFLFFRMKIILISWPCGSHLKWSTLWFVSQVYFYTSASALLCLFSDP